MEQTARTLTDQEIRAWRALVYMTYLFDAALDRQMIQDAGMPHTYYMVLAILYEAKDRTLRMSALARRLRFSPSRLAHAMKSMEKTGLVRREPAEHDRRVQLAILEPKGLELIRRVGPLQVIRVRTRLLDRLQPDQLDQLTELCNLILAGLEDETIA